MADLSVIIVTWNSEREIKECIESVIGGSKDIPAEIIVIDNDSADNTLNFLQKINSPILQIHKNDTNLGYTKAINQGYNKSTGKFILLLNPDTVLREDSINILMKFLYDKPAYGACAPLLLNEDGTVQYSVRGFPDYWTMFLEFSLLAYIFPKTKLFGRWKMKYFDYSNDSDIEQPMAAAFMVKRSVIKDADIMDERYEMFFNDVDLCKTIIDSGQKIRLVTGSKVTHGLGKSVNKDKVRMIKIWGRDCVKYFEKYHNNPLLLLWLKINLKVSEILRILYYKLFKS
jgi:O-antigen biosynthesis protein